MKSIIIYCSTYQGNTYKIAKAMAESISARLATVEESQQIDLSQYDLIGLGSGINFAQHHKQLLLFVAKSLFEQKSVFLFSTRCRPFLGGYHKTLRELLEQKGATVVGEFSARGFDRTGPWVAINGYNKGRPNVDDQFKAWLFAKNMRKILLSSLVERGGCAEGKAVRMNTSTCLSCGKCVRSCPMQVFGLVEHADRKILPIGEENCIQCNTCENVCPSDSIYVQQSFARGLRIMVTEIVSDRLQKAYGCWK